MPLNSLPGRLPIRKIAITVPPAGWFHGIASALFKLYRQALVDLGLEIFDVPVDAFLPPDAVRISGLISGLRAFGPELAFGLSYGSYALICRLPAGRDGSRPNLFTDILNVPTLCLWDHAPLELASQLLTPHPRDPGESAGGAMESLRRVLTHPRLIHWSRDSGQTRIMKDLGFVLPNRLIQEMPPALPGFGPPEKHANLPDGKNGVAFVGHFYQEPPHFSNPSLAILADQAIRTWVDAYNPPFGDELDRRIADLPSGLRHQLRLDPDQTFFWHFAQQLTIHQAQTALRLKVLGSADLPVECYGNLRTDLPGVPKNLVAIPTNIPYGPELAALFAHHPITIDTLNPGFIHGYSHKQVHGFASGGFMLMNRKQDFVNAFGESGEAVSFVDGGDLNDKVDRFLSNPQYRREVGDAIREKILGSFQLKDVLARVLHAAFLCTEPSGGHPHPADSLTRDHRVVTVRNLLPEVRSERHWLGASARHVELGVRIVTAPEEWAYAAIVDIPAIVSSLREPFLRVSLIVESGRMGVFASDQAAEQHITQGPDAVTIMIELQQEGMASLILRNTVPTVTQALVLEIALCDRVRFEN